MEYYSTGTSPYNLVSGEIHNTPYRFCDGDRLLIDAEAGFGSEIYSSISVGSVLSNGDGHFLEYFEVPISFTGYEEQNIKTTITPLDIDEATNPTFSVRINRYFGSNIAFEDTSDWVLDMTNIDYQLLNFRVEIVGMNPPHIHRVKYVNESTRQIGVKDTSLKIYDNVGKDLLSKE